MGTYDSNDNDTLAQELIENDYLGKYKTTLQDLAVKSDQSILNLVEEWASFNNEIESKEELSDKFDNEIMPHILEQFGVKGEEFTDTTMVNEEFNNWSDNLCKDGEIHEEQYNNYCYVGKWSKD